VVKFYVLEVLSWVSQQHTNILYLSWSAMDLVHFVKRFSIFYYYK